VAGVAVVSMVVARVLVLVGGRASHRDAAFSRASHTEGG
jgi:hypothetical protein